MTHFAVTKTVRRRWRGGLSLDFMDPLFKRDVADKIDRLNETRRFRGSSTTCRWRRDGVVSGVPRSGRVDVRADRAGPDHDERGQVRVCLAMEYDAAAEKGGRWYPPRS